MDLIDDYGRIAGLVNVIDLLAVLGVTAVLVAGLALLDVSTLAVGGVLAVGALAVGALAYADDPDTRTVYAVLDVGTVPPSVARKLIDGAGALSVVDAYLTPAPDGVETVVEVALDQRPYQSAPEYRGQELEDGSELTLRVGARDLDATVLETNAEPSLDRTETALLVSAELPIETALAIEDGDSFPLAGREVATVESVARGGTTDPDVVRTALGLTVDTRLVEDAREFAGEPLRTGREIPFRTARYELEGTIDRVGTTEAFGEPVTRTLTVKATDVSPDWRDAIEPGLEERIGGETIATVQSVSPPDGAADELARTDGTGTDLRLTVELAARETESGLRFKGAPIELGSTVTLSLGTLTLTPTVVGLE
ncbi:hypothetical protein ACFQH2_05875 [Natronoarchaeum sp. GCM10025703]|uniref:hypothetical protein n=1 Tax=unclassified Natronoarchaeum TaxID=2620183 RepID=UPI003611E50F